MKLLSSSSEIAEIGFETMFSNTFTPVRTGVSAEITENSFSFNNLF
jgi:hypothetical protein